MERHFYFFGIIFLLVSIEICAAQTETTTDKSAATGQKSKERIVVDTQTQCMEGEQGVMCQAEAVAAIVDEDGNIQSSHSDSREAAASGAEKSNPDDKPDDEPGEVEDAGN